MNKHSTKNPACQLQNNPLISPSSQVPEVPGDSPEVPENSLAPVQLDTQAITFPKIPRQGAPLATKSLKINGGFCGSNDDLQEIITLPYSRKGRKAHRDTWRDVFLTENVEMALRHKARETKTGRTVWPFRNAYLNFMQCGERTHVVRCQNCGGRHQLPWRCHLGFICSECAWEQAVRALHRFLPRIEKALSLNRKGGRSLMHLVLTNRVEDRVLPQAEIDANNKAVKGLCDELYGEKVCLDCSKAFSKHEDKVCPYCRDDKVKVCKACGEVFARKDYKVCPGCGNQTGQKGGKGFRSKGQGWAIDGLVFSNEVKGFNLHNHCLVFGKVRDKRLISRLWKRRSKGRGEIIRIKEIRCKQGTAKKTARRVLGYIVKHIKKPGQFEENEKGQRVAVQWMLAFQGIRSIHSYGRFFKIGESDPSYAKAPHCCPYCGADRWSLFTDDLITEKRMADALGIPTWYEAMEMEGLISGRDPPEVENGWAIFKRGRQAVYKKISRLSPFDDGRPWIPGSLRDNGEASA